MDLFRYGLRNSLLITLLIHFGGCTSEVIVDLVSKNSNASLYLAKTAPINAQIINQLTLEVGESVTLYSLLDRSTGSYENIKVRWSLIGIAGILTVKSSAKEADFSSALIGTGHIEVEDSGLVKRITVTIIAGATPAGAAPTVANLTPSNETEDAEKIVILSYTDADGDKGTSCSVSTLSNIQETTPCSCDGAGVCSVGVKGITAFNGAASFNYTVTAGGDTSNIANANFTIDDVITTCPTGFVEADGNNTLSTKDFCVMKYEARNDGGGLAVSQAAGTPWISIAADDGIDANDTDAFEKCSNMTEGGFTGTFALISNPEWMTIARDIESVGTNWTGGTIGAGNLSRGWSANLNDDGFFNNGHAPTTDLTCLYNTSNDTCGAGGVHRLRRTHQLTNGSEVWDFSGNVAEFVDWDSGSPGFTVGPIDGVAGAREINNLVGSLTMDDVAPLGPYTSAQQTGVLYSSTSGGAAIRGGAHGSGFSFGTPVEGPFYLNLAFTSSSISTAVGFRCSYRPQQAPITKSITPANANENTESIYTLSYGDVNGDLATSCNVTDLTNLTETTPCSCDGGGLCTVGITGENNYSGAASFNYTVTDDDGVSNVANANFSISANILCPTGFVEVNGNGTLGTTDFCVMKYEAKNDGGGNAVSQTVNPPWVIISADNAQSKCEAMTEGGFSGTFSLISNPEWMTIARDIESVGTNWSGSITGSGNLARGWSAKTAEDGFQNTAVAPVTDGTCIFNSAADTCAAIGTHKLRRTHQLSNGSEIWDLAGNVWEWVDWDTATLGFTVGPADGDAGGWNELNDLVGSLTIDDVAPLGPYTSVQQAGRLEPTTAGGGAALRGGDWNFGATVGVFALRLSYFTSDATADLGFRCTYRP